MKPDARTAREHAETVREALHLIGPDGCELVAEHEEQLTADAALAALLTEVEYLSHLNQEHEDDRETHIKIRANLLAQVERLEQERDEAKRATERGDQLLGQCGRALEAAEARAQRYREALVLADEKLAGFWSYVEESRTALKNTYVQASQVIRRALSADPLVCRDPNLCWGTGTCPRDPACNE